MLHWIQPGLHVHSNRGALLNISESGVIPYVGPQPNPGPKHSYVFLLYRQPDDFVFPDCFAGTFPPTPEARGGFDIDQFAREVGLGGLVAANWLRCGSSERAGEPPLPTGTSLSVPPCGRPTAAADTHWEAASFQAEPEL
jgi:phosphatidylethanolamine-binding protein